MEVLIVKFFQRYNKSDIFVLLLTIFYIIKLNNPDKSIFDVVAVITIIVWVLMCFFKSLSPSE